MWPIFGHDGGGSPEGPLVDLGLLEVGLTQEGGVTVSEELGDGDGLVEVALLSLEERELDGEVLGLALSGVLGDLIDDDELYLLASELGSDESGLNEDVVVVVRVDLL